MKKINIRVQRKIHLPFPKKEIVDLLWKLENISKYQPKVNSIIIKWNNKRLATCSSTYRVAGINWVENFSIIISENGFRKKLISGILANQVHGGYMVRDITHNSSDLILYRQYNIPFIFSFLTKPLKKFLLRSLGVEMRKIEFILSEEFESIPEKISA